MQGQLSRTEAQSITSTQSLASVQTLLKAGLGCITFMRDLLPHDNFSECHFTTSDDSMSYQLSDASNSSVDSRHKRNVNGFKIMAMTRGYTDEADRILNYLEFGIFDALQRQYLRSFIFAIYLDSNDPKNIVEAYTFNFQYYTIPGTDATIPIMSLGDSLNKMSLSADQRKDPVSEAIKKGKIPTLRDVKRSVKTMLKTLITSMTQMDVLPKRRYASFKLFYTDKTPSDYEPPHFQAGDVEKDKWYFMTHDLDEVPDRWSVGKLDTGHHSVDVNVTSIATFLPSSTEHDDAPFAGTTSRAPAVPCLTPAQEAAVRADQVEKQTKDADNRNIVWAVESKDLTDDADADAEGDDDPDYDLQADGSYTRRVARLHETRMVPIGLRNDSGEIEPITVPVQMDVDEMHFGGVSQSVPTRLDEMLAPKGGQAANFEQTQPVDGITQDEGNDTSSSDFVDDSLLHTPGHRHRSSAESSPMSSIHDIDDIDTQMLKDLVLDNVAVTDDTEMLDMETQAIADIQSPFEDTIESFGENNNAAEDHIEDVPPARENGDEMDCECGIDVQDASCYCEGTCGRWYHLWCMGYHSAKDDRLPTRFICFDCRVKADISWELIKVDLYPTMISKYKELALFRRAIKTVERRGPKTPTDFANMMGSDSALARQLLKRLETEGFISEEAAILDESGAAQSRARSHKKGKGKQAKPRRNVQKPKYIFNHQSKSTQEYLDYFNPDHEVECRLIGLPQSKRSVKAHSKTPLAAPADVPQGGSNDDLASLTILYNETQTQDETQTVFTSMHSAMDLKRTATAQPEHSARPKKKIKISVAAGVDLAE